MDTQKETSRQGEEAISDKNTDVTRSQNREGAANSSSGNQVVEGDNGHHGADETGSHQEGQYDKDH